MKVGDKIYNTKLRPDADAKIVRSYWSNDKNEKGKNIIKTWYQAVYPDGFRFIFYGFNIGKNIFYASDRNRKQLSIFDLEENNG